jgi:beta-glucosidase-like glycosyl hydrolase
MVAATNSLQLTDKEIEKLNQFAEGIPVHKGVGQFFMINLPINYVESFNRRSWKDKEKGNGKINYKQPIHKRLIEEGFGSILLQKSNFKFLNEVAETEEERLSLITGFVNNLQYRAISKKNKGIHIPLFIAVDFEGPLTNKIKETLIPPPPALTLAISRNKKSIENTGKIVGYQLGSSGINMLLGPVLDIDKTEQGHYNDILKNRSFSSHADGVIVTAAYYIKGLREAGITVISKHFPGLGLVKGNPHREIVSFQGTMTDLKEHLRPYRELRPLLNGVMTSHVTLPFLKNNNQPATFNQSIIEFIRGKPFPQNSSLQALDYNHELILTDDLGMRAITNYTKKRKINYSSMVIDAIQAGHDIVMFAKVLADSESNKPGGIHIDQLIQAKKKLTEYLKLPNNRKKYEVSLQRIIRAKAASYKLHGGNIDHFISESMNKVLRSQLQVPDSVKGVDGFLSHDKVKYIYEDIIEKSYLLLKSGYSYSIENSKSICIFTPKKHQKNYQDLKYLYREKLHISNDIHDDDKTPLTNKIKKIKKHIKENACDIIFIVVNSAKSTDRIKNVMKFLKETKNHITRIVLLLHQTPISLDKNIINNKNITIMGAFTDHVISYSTDIKVIKGDITPKNISQLTIDYNNEIFKKNIKKPDIEKMSNSYVFGIKSNHTDKAKELYEKDKKKLEVEIKILKNKLELEKHQQKKIQLEKDKLKKYKLENNNNFGNMAHENILLLIIVIIFLVFIIYLFNRLKNI